MNHKLSRRAFLDRSVTAALLAAGTLVPVAGVTVHTRAFAQSPAVDPADPTAKALEYVTKSPKPDQTCAGCALYQGKAGDSQGPCAIFPGRAVAAGGWCKSWVKKS
jgi:hypothetical protein